MSHYPDRWHVCYFLSDALTAIGVRNDVIRDERTLNCWGFVFPDFDNRVMVWLIDNRLPNEQIKEDPAAKDLLARGAIVAHAQKPDMNRVGGVWLPIAASPGFYPVDMVKTATAAFVGYIQDEGRARLLSDIGARHTLTLAQNVFGKRAVETYCSALCGVNIVSHYGQPFAIDSANMRLFEVMACGVPLVTEFQSYLNDLGLIPGHNVLLYRDNNSLIECLDFVVKNPEYAVEVGDAGRQLILDRHLYSHRAETVKSWLSA